MSPLKPSRPCRIRSCPNLTDDSTGLCEDHLKADRKSYDLYKRDSLARKFYISHAWRLLRLTQLALKPLCENCLEQGYVVGAVIVDHKQPLDEYPELALDLTNLRSLCPSCHSKKHGWGKTYKFIKE